MTPVKRLALNLGAPGRPQGRVRRAVAGLSPAQPARWCCRCKSASRSSPAGATSIMTPRVCKIEDPDKPWLFCSGVRGLRQCTIPLAEPADGTGALHGAAGVCRVGPRSRRQAGLRHQAPRQGRGREASTSSSEAGGRNKPLIKEFQGIDADRGTRDRIRPRGRQPGA